jgi:hypothetical protein
MNFSGTEIKQSKKRQEAPMLDLVEIIEDLHKEAVDTMRVINAAIKDIENQQ